MKNILKKWQKEARKKNKNKHQWGWFVNPNAGNVEYNNAFFNHVTGADGGDTGVLVSAAAEGEGLGESMKQETVTLYYKDIEVSGGYGPFDWETGGHRYEYNDTIDYEYEVDRDEIFEELWEMELETPSEVSEGEFMSEEELESYINTNFYELVEKHYDELLEIFRERAEEQANEEYEYDEYMESINLVEALNSIDAKTFNKFDLVNSYHAASLTEAKKQKLANLIKKGANALKLAEFFDDNSDWQIGLELFADNGKEYKVVSVLEDREVDGYELSVVSAIGNEASNADEEAYFVLLDSDIEWGPVDTAEEALEWASDVQDGYYNDDDYDDDYDTDSIDEEVEENLMTEDWKDAYRYHVVTMMPPKFKNILQGGSNDFDSAERIAIDAMKRYASNPWEDDDRKIEAIENMLIIDRNADPDSKDYAQVTLRMEKVMDRLVDKIDPTDGIRESAMSELDVEIQSAGGLDAWIKDIKEKLKRSSKNLYFLNTQARREINAGGAFDSVEELEDAIEAEQREYNELKDKYDFVASSAMDNIRSNKLMNNFNEVFDSIRSSRKSRESKLTESITVSDVVDYIEKMVDSDSIPYDILDDIDVRDDYDTIYIDSSSSDWNDYWSERLCLSMKRKFGGTVEATVIPAKYTSSGYDLIKMVPKKLTESVSHPYRSGTYYIWDGESQVPKDVMNVIIRDGVTEIKENSFAQCRSLHSIDIPDSVTKIGERAFSDCSYLWSIDIPNSVTEIGERAFAHCVRIESIDIPSSVTEIGAYAFADCSRLESINIPNSVTKIGAGTLLYCTSLKSIDIPGSVTEIGKKAFYYCESLNSIDIPGSVTKIDVEAFAHCKSLESVNISNGVIEISSHAFNYCESLTSINIPDSVTRIGRNAFYGCMSLKSINLPSGVTEIGWEAFHGCSRLESVNIPDGVTEIGWRAFYYCESLKSVNIPNSVTRIYEYAFTGCRSLKSVTVPSSVTEIGERAFAICESLESVNIPSSVTKISEATFAGCRSLKSVNIPNSVTEIGKDAFYGCPLDDRTKKRVNEIVNNVKMNERFSKSKLTESLMSRNDMIDWLEDNWNATEEYEQLYAAIDAIGYDSDHLDDSDREEGIYANFSDEDLENIISVLKTGKTKDGYDTSVKPQKLPVTDSRAKDTFKLALDNLGRATEIDKGVSSALAMYRVMIDGKEYQVQVYKMD